MRTSASSFLAYLSENIFQLEERCVPLWHPLGFVSCVIRGELGQYVVRVHYWPRDERRVKNPDWPIHTHVYALSSFVLSGVVRDLQYGLVPGDQYVIYRVRYYGGDSEIVRTNKCTGIEVASDQLRKGGEQYWVEQGVFHQTQVPREKSAVTLVVLSDLKDEAPLVLGTPQEQRYPYERIAFDRQRFWRAVEEAVSEAGWRAE